MIDEDNKYAFPGQTDRKWYLGLTKRELFALALAHADRARGYTTHSSKAKFTASYIVEQADALIKELENDKD